MPSIKNKNIDISKIKVIQAPLAGISDIVFRTMIRKFGSKCLMTTEMISSEMLCNNPNPRIIQFDKTEYPLSFQLVGHKIDKMTTAAKILAPFASMIDINCGCPVKKVVVSNDGSGMMKNPKLAGDILKSIKDATGLPVSVKFRLGWSNSEENYIEFGKEMQKAGADFVVLHGRTRSQMYQGHADWSKIGILKKELDIPVFANGDITTIQEAIDCINLTKCDGIAIGRGIMGDFSLPYRIEQYFEKGIILEEPDLKERVEMLKEHLKKEVQNMGEINGVKFMRKFYNYYISSVRNASKYRSKLVLIEKEKEILEILDEILSVHYQNC